MGDCGSDLARFSGRLVPRVLLLELLLLLLELLFRLFLWRLLPRLLRLRLRFGAGGGGITCNRELMV